MIVANKIKDVIVKSYINGILGSLNEADVMAGFHESFKMFVKKENDLIPVSIQDWYNNMKKAVEKNPERKNIVTSYSFLHVDCMDNVASVKVEIYRNNKYFSTDFFFLYLFEDGWKIVAKAYHM